MPTYYMKPAWMRTEPLGWRQPEWGRRPDPPPPRACPCPTCASVREQVERVRRERVTP